MVNPFKHTGKVMGSLWTSAAQSDCAPGPAKVGVVLVAPIVVSFALVHSLFMKGGQ